MFVLRSLLFWLLVSSGIALVWPDESFGYDPFLLENRSRWILIALTMFALGTLIRREELEPLRRRPWWVGYGIAAQVLVMPLAAWLMTQIVPLPDDIAAGVILVGCVPGAMASNVLTKAAGGNVAYSVSLTSVATLLSPITVPTALWLLSRVDLSDVSMKPQQVAMQLAVRVVIPTILGYLLSRKSSHVRRLASRVASPVAAIALLWIIASVVASSRESLFDVAASVLGVLLVINAIGYAAGFGVASVTGLPEGFRRALTLEVGMQNAGLGTVLAAMIYGDGTAAMIPTAAYTFGCMLTGTLLVQFWTARETVEKASQAG